MEGEWRGKDHACDEEETLCILLVVTSSISGSESGNDVLTTKRLPCPKFERDINIKGNADEDDNDR